MPLRDYLKYGTRIAYKRGASPLYFVFFVTERCNARCAHCLLGERDGRNRDELTIDEIARVSASMDDMLFFTPTGGEPFLRPDLSEIVRIFRANNRAANVGIPTNGSLPERVVDSVRRMLAENPGLDLHVDVSLDGPPAVHDSIRARPGLYEQALTTYRELRALERHHPHLSVCIQITVSAYNQDVLVEHYGTLKREVGVNTVFTLLTRGAPRDPAARDVDIDKYEAFERLLAADNKALVLSGYYKMPFSDVLNAKRIVRPQIIARTVREGRAQLPCYAGTLGGAMFSSGQVLACELLVEKEMGNVREADYDFKRIWCGPRAQEIRRWIRDTRCFCTYECFLTVNILFNPLVLPWVGKEWAALRLARLRQRVRSGDLSRFSGNDDG